MHLSIFIACVLFAIYLFAIEIYSFQEILKETWFDPTRECIFTFLGFLLFFPLMPLHCKLWFQKFKEGQDYLSFLLNQSRSTTMPEEEEDEGIATTTTSAIDKLKNDTMFALTMFVTSVIFTFLSIVRILTCLTYLIIYIISIT